MITINNPLSEKTIMSEIVSEQLRAAVLQAKKRGWSVNRIAMETGLSQPALQDWLNGKSQGLKQQSIDALCDFLEMRLTRPKIRSPRKPQAGAK